MQPLHTIYEGENKYIKRQRDCITEKKGKLDMNKIIKQTRYFCAEKVLDYDNNR